MTRWSVAAGVVGLLIAARPAGAQTEGTSAQYERGVGLREQHRDEEALAVFRGVYETTHEARALAQVALAEGELGRLVDAEAHLVEALTHSDERWIRRNRRSLETALERLRTHLGSLAVECATPGAELWISGQRVAGLPMARPLRVVSGTVTYEVRASGFATVSRSVQVPTAPVLQERVELQPQASAVAAAPVVAPPVEATPVATTAAATAATPVVVATVPASAVSAPVQERAAAPLAPDGGGRRTLAWVGIGASAALVAGGVVAMVMREAAAGRYNVGGCLGEGVPVESEPTAACRDDRETVSTMQTLGVVGLVAGGALAVGSVVLMVTAPGRGGSRERATGMRVVCGGGPGTIGVACGGAF
ncbi:MAG: hypothetical protein Q8S73_11700 [Deltaproteobacteria bacterium]|nr:hypothetical protein [Myxococcales bacterium]MDP3214762.1 hypothetical protein [Deltaproteobacteria bacterium]